MEKETVILDKFTDDAGQVFTNCSLEDNPEVVVAAMAENIPANYQRSDNLSTKFTVAMPAEAAGIATEVNIWFSEQTDGGILAYVIQSYFDSRFPDFGLKEGTQMGISEPGKILVRSG